MLWDSSLLIFLVIRYDSTTIFLHTLCECLLPEKIKNIWNYRNVTNYLQPSNYRNEPPLTNGKFMDKKYLWDLSRCIFYNYLYNYIGVFAPVCICITTGHLPLLNYICHYRTIEPDGNSHVTIYFFVLIVLKKNCDQPRIFELES